MKKKAVLWSHLIRRGYKGEMINREFRKVDKVTREEALKSPIGPYLLQPFA